jgi:protein-ribulosamine 3-kinase
MFAGEALGLKAMYETKACRIPEVLHWGNDGRGGSYIIMEFLPLGGRGSQKELGRAIAKMHLAAPTSCEEAAQGKFGFPVDNTIGGTSQPNKWEDDWPTFFREQRIGHQVRLAGDGQLQSLWNKVCSHTKGLATLFDDVEVKPSCLHGDLWSGNINYSDGEPTIYDPATYYGHHEAEWGMSWCAGFGSDFWEGYRELIPEDKNFKKRRDLYELYHKLNHYNLFGSGYYSDSVSLMERLLK